MFKYELHCHNKNVSVCASVSSEELTDMYVKAGYSGIVLTNHMSVATYKSFPSSSWEKMCDHFIAGYTSLKDASQGLLDVFLGMEICFRGSCNDYLVYGLDEDFLYQNEFLFDMNISSFSKLAKDAGLLVFQAHPFRNRMTIVDPSYLDGYEVFNGNAGHDSRNDFAALWCEKMGKLSISGSDVHHASSTPSGGIFTEDKIGSYPEMLALLSSGANLIK